jgi:phytoene dehydrogenase-like protein
VGRIAETLAEGLSEYGGVIEYGANVTKILTRKTAEGEKQAYAVKLSDGREIR